MHVILRGRPDTHVFLAAAMACNCRAQGGICLCVRGGGCAAAERGWVAGAAVRGQAGQATRTDRVSGRRHARFGQPGAYPAPGWRPQQVIREAGAFVLSMIGSGRADSVQEET